MKVPFVLCMHTTVQYALLVGADGAGSRVRQLMWVGAMCAFFEKYFRLIK